MAITTYAKMADSNNITEVEVMHSRPFPLPYLGAIKVDGPDAKKFLQGQLTCNLEKISETQSSLAAHCNPKGRVISLFYIVKSADFYYLILPIEMINIAIATLKKYVLFYKANLIDVSNEIMVAGQESANLPNAFPYITIPTTNNRYLLLVPKINELQFTHSNDMIHQWRQQDIQDKIPTIYPETSGQLLPQEINLIALNAISFDKGCYTGQEIIARLHYRGKAKTALFSATLQCKETPMRGIDIYQKSAGSAKVCGVLVDIAEKQALISTSNLIDNNKPLYLTQSDEKFYIIT